MYDRYYSNTGIFRFYFWANADWVAINIDDRLPSRSWGSGWRPKTAGASDQNAWWLPLMEKAYAKLNQNYERIAWGRGSESLRALTGKPTIKFSHKEVNSPDLLTMHKYWAANDFPQVASCCNAVPGGIAGLSSGHAYSLLDIKELTWSDGTLAHRIAKMRNPWNKEDYRGKWSDFDPAWSEEWKKQAGLV